MDKRPSYRSDNVARKFYLANDLKVPNNGSFRDGVLIKIVGFSRWYNGATSKWLTTAILMYRLPGVRHDWRTCSDIVTGMSYADHYYWLHAMAINPAVRYGKPGKRTPTYDAHTAPLAQRHTTERVLREAREADADVR